MFLSVHNLIGNRIRLRRLELGYAADALAKKVGWSEAELDGYETAKRQIAADKLYALCAVLQAPITYFFGSVGGGTRRELRLPKLRPFGGKVLGPAQIASRRLRSGTTSMPPAWQLNSTGDLANPSLGLSLSERSDARS